MFLKNIQLQNYRNYSELDLQTANKVNVFLGPNAQGKTNLLEAIFVLALTKSHRTSKDKELIGWQAETARITGEVDKKYGSIKLDLLYSAQGKKAKINGLEQRKLSDFIGSVNVVMFAPEDLEIVKGTPGIRRRFLDMEIGQVQPGYLHTLQQYGKVLLQRNNFLKASYSGGANQTMLDVWNMQLAEHGVKIMKKGNTLYINYKRLQNKSMQALQTVPNSSQSYTVLHLTWMPSKMKLFYLSNL